jgi:hypothetical protein
MRLACSLVGLSFSAALCASARAQTTPASYDEQAVGVRSLGSANPDMPPSGERPAWLHAEGKWDAFRGPDHHPISEEAFYRIVGREDLLFRYQHRAAIKKAAMVSGGALLVGGLIFAAIADLPRGTGVYACPSPGCTPADHSGVSPGWGLAIAGTGLVGLVVGHYLNPTTISAGEADAIARDYDQLLKSRLGISETALRE